MKNDKIINSWSKVKFDNATHERILGNILNRVHSPKNQKGKVFNMSKMINWKILTPITACLIIAIVIAIPLLNNNGGEFDLVLSNGVKVGYINNPPNVRSENQLLFLSEEELFAAEWEGFEIAVFEGEIIKVENIALSFGNGWNHKSYRAIVTIEVSSVFRGDIKVGDSVTVLLLNPINEPNPTSESVWVEDTSVSSQMTIGTKGIFTPIKYNNDSIWEENGSTLYLQEIAEYGLPDGERWAFLDKPNGVAFARHAYTGILDYEKIEGVPTMDEIRQYVNVMLGNETAIN